MAIITDEEYQALKLIGDAYAIIAELPIAHNADHAELVRDIHDIQNRILARVGLRAMRERDSFQNP